MSSIKNYLYNEKYSPSAEDMAEYELYCYFLDMKERMEAEDFLDFFAEAFGGEE